MIEVVVVSPSAPTTAWVCDSGATPATPSIARIAVRVLAGQRGAGAAVRAGGRDRQQVRAEARQALGDARRRPLPHADEGDHRRDADDDAEHRQGRPERGPSGGARTRAGRARGSSCHEPPVADVHLAAGRRGDLGVVGDEDDRAARAVELAEELEHLAARGLVEVAGRLVGEDQGRVGDQRAGDGDALLLAAGQLGRLVVDAVAEAEPLERRGRPARPLAPGRRPGRAAASRRSRARSSAAAGCTTGRRTRSSGCGSAPAPSSSSSSTGVPSRR